MSTTKPRKTVNVDEVTAAALVALAEKDGRSFSNYAARVLRDHVAAVNPLVLGEDPPDEDLPGAAGQSALNKTPPPPTAPYPERKAPRGRGTSGGETPGGRPGKA